MQTNNNTMRASVYNRYGGAEVLHITDVPRPSPTPKQLLVRVHAAAVNRTDSGFRTGMPIITRFFSGLFKPKFNVLGTEFAGEVVAIGDDVTKFAVGDRVFGVNANGFSTHAQYACIDEDAPVALMPSTVTFEEAAGVSDGVILALTNLRRGKVADGTRILIYGASGSIGTAGVQLAKHMGAYVTAVCGTEQVDLIGSLGADEVIDRHLRDFTSVGDTYDIVFDAVGKSSFRKCRRLLVNRGKYLTTDLGFMWQNPLLWLLTSRLPTKRAYLPIPTYRKAEVELLRDLLESGDYRPVIDRTYPLEQVVEATRYVDTQGKVGNVVLSIG